MDDVGKLAVAGANFEQKNPEPVNIMHRDLGFKHGELAFFFGNAHSGSGATSHRADNVYDLHGARNDPRFDTNDTQEDKAEGHIPYLHLVNGDIQPDQLTQAEHHDLPLDHAGHAEDSLTGIVLNYNHRNDVKPGYATEEERDQSSLLMGQNRRFNVEPNGSQKKSEQRYYEMLVINRLNLEFSQRLRDLDRQIQELQRRIDILDDLGAQVRRDTANGEVINANTEDGRLKLEEYQRKLDRSNSELKIKDYLDASGNFDRDRFLRDQDIEAERLRKERDILRTQQKQEIENEEQKRAQLQKEIRQSTQASNQLEAGSSDIALNAAANTPVNFDTDGDVSLRTIENNQAAQEQENANPGQDISSLLGGMGFAIPETRVAANPSVNATSAEPRLASSAPTPAPPVAASVGFSENFAASSRALGSYASTADGSEIENVIAASFNKKANNVSSVEIAKPAEPKEELTTTQFSQVANASTAVTSVRI